jgi:hypothetical protein
MKLRQFLREQCDLWSGLQEKRGEIWWEIFSLLSPPNILFNLYLANNHNFEEKGSDAHVDIHSIRKPDNKLEHAMEHHDKIRMRALAVAISGLSLWGLIIGFGGIIFSVVGLFSG